MSRGYANRGYQNGVTFHDVDDIPMSNERYTPIVLRPNNLEYPPRDRESVYAEKDEFAKGKRSKSSFRSKLCLIGFAIGLLIGLLICVAIAVPVGVVKNCLGQFASTPNWIGTYQMDGHCDTIQCCCLTGTVTITKTSSYLMQISGSIIGSCTGFPSPMRLETSIPSSFTTEFSWSGQAIRLLLGQDNFYLAFINLKNAVCTATAVKTSNNPANEKSISFYLIIFLLFIAFNMIK